MDQSSRITQLWTSDTSLSGPELLSCFSHDREAIPFMTLSTLESYVKSERNRLGLGTTVPGAATEGGSEAQPAPGSCKGQAPSAASHSRIQKGKQRLISTQNTEQPAAMGRDSTQVITLGSSANNAADAVPMSLAPPPTPLQYLSIEHDCGPVITALLQDKDDVPGHDL